MTKKRSTPSKSQKINFETLIHDKIQLQRPGNYQVILLNDDYTPMEFVVEIMGEVFRHNSEKALETTMQIHNIGSAICGEYTYEIAETKIAEVAESAHANDFPLQCIMEKV